MFSVMIREATKNELFNGHAIKSLTPPPSSLLAAGKNSFKNVIFSSLAGLLPPPFHGHKNNFY